MTNESSYGAESVMVEYELDVAESEDVDAIGSEIESSERSVTNEVDVANSNDEPNLVMY